MTKRGSFDNFPVEKLEDISEILEGKSNRCTGKQRQWIHSMLNDLNYSDEEALSMIGKEYLAEEFENPLREITLEEASELIDELKPIHYDHKRGGSTGFNSYNGGSRKTNSIGGWF